MGRWLLATLLLAVTVACALRNDLGQFQYRLAKGIDQACGNQPRCKIKLVNYTNFQWDYFYVFPYQTSEARIAQILGQPLSGWKEFSVHQVFVLGGKIVHREDYAADIEKPLRREVVFVVPARTDFVQLTPEEGLLATKEETYFVVDRAAVKSH